jgi:hypothetical protein
MIFTLKDWVLKRTASNTNRTLDRRNKKMVKGLNGSRKISKVKFKRIKEMDQLRPSILQRDGN